MLPTFVIGLREGLEASLIVSIIATFLRQQGRADLLRWVFLGVATAVLLCLGVGAALEVLSRDLPQRQQEGLETVVGALAVTMVTYMVVWMRRHSRELKGSLEGAAAAALADQPTAAARAMVAMAFLAVLREGFETVVFLLATFHETGNTTAAAAGAVLGIAVAIGLGWGIYRGGVRLNLSKFFRATGLVLVLVAAGLVVTALHTAHEAGWLNAGQGSTIDLSWLVRANSVRASLLTGMLGIQGHPVVIEVIAWVAYVVPVGTYVAWPPGRTVPRRRLAVAAGLGGVVAAAAALIVVLLAPSVPGDRPVTNAGRSSVRLLPQAAAGLMIRTQPTGSAGTDLAIHRVGATSLGGVGVDRYTGTAERPATDAGWPATMSRVAVARLNGGRLPLGLSPSSRGRIPVTYTEAVTVNAAVEPRTQRLVDLTWTRRVDVTLNGAAGTIPLDHPIRRSVQSLPAASVSAALVAARSDLGRLDTRADLRGAGAGLAGLAGCLLLVGAGCGVLARRGRRAVSTGEYAPVRLALPNSSSRGPS
jgi:high-affinity iron transporter